MCYIRAVARRWIVFVHQLPAHPSNGRVRIWRRLRQIGAVALKNAVHVLRDSAQAVEDFEWLREEVVALGGQASIFSVASMSEDDEQYVVEECRAARARTLKKETNALQTAHRPVAKARGASPGSRLDRETYRNRVWVTRPRPGVDRFASAWLIRRLIDPGATFAFAASPDGYPGAVAFDMYHAAGFTHAGNLCTFEVLQGRFGIRDVAVRRIAEIVHDIDIKEDRYTSPHVPTVAHLVDGLRASTPDDTKLLEHGMVMFEALYQSFQAARRKSGGRERIP
jgi:hypothetical protein